MLFQYTFFPLLLLSDTVLYITVQCHFWSLYFWYSSVWLPPFSHPRMRYATRFRSAYHLVSSSVGLSFGGGAHYPLISHFHHPTPIILHIYPLHFPAYPPTPRAPLNHPPFSLTPSLRSAARSLIPRYPRWYILKTPKTPLCRRYSGDRRSRSTRWIHIYR